MRILHISPKLNGGAAKYEIFLCKGLVDAGHTVSMVSSGQHGGIPDADIYIKEMEALGIKYDVINFFQRGDDIFWPAVSKLQALLKDYNPDLVHVHSGYPALGASVARSIGQHRMPIVATFYSWGLNRPDWMNVCDAFAFNQCDSIIFLSTHYQEFGISQGINPLKTGVIHPGFRFSDIRKGQNRGRDALSTLGVSSSHFVVSTLGAIQGRKGQLDLVKAVWKVIEAIPELKPKLKLLLIGDTTVDQGYLFEINGYVDNHDLNDTVIMTGWVEDPYTYLGQSDLFVFPTYNEGFGMVIVEAMALGIPVCASFVEGTKDVLAQEENALTFTPGDIDGIAQCIKESYQDHKKTQERTEMAKGSVQRFSYERFIGKYLDEYARLIG